MIDAERVQEPIVERPVVGVLQRAEGVRDALDGIGLAVRPVVHGINTPAVAGAVMRGLADAVHDRVAQVQVGRGHVDLRAQRPRTLRELAGAHAREEIEIFCDRARARRAVAARLRQRAAILAHLVGTEIVDVGFAGLDQLHRPRVELLEIIGREIEMLAPVESEPAHVGFDGLDVFGFLFRGVGVVETQVTMSAEVRRQSKVQADCLGVANMKIAVGFRREARDDAPIPLLRDAMSSATIARIKSGPLVGSFVDIVSLLIQCGRAAAHQIVYAGE